MKQPISKYIYNVSHFDSANCLVPNILYTYWYFMFKTRNTIEILKM